MSIAIVRSLFAGSLILLAPLRVVADSPKMGTNSEAARSAPPAVVLAHNIAVASPGAATQFTPQRGYTGDLSLLATPHPRRVRASVVSSDAGSKPIGSGPMLAAPNIPLFDVRLPESQFAEPLLKTVSPDRAPGKTPSSPAPSPK